MLRATARKPAFAKAAATRLASRVAKSSVTAPATWAAMNSSRNVDSAQRGASRRAATAMTGAPRTIPAAKAEVRVPARPTETPRSAAIPGRSPARTNSEVPWAKTATASRWSRTGMNEPSEERGMRGRMTRPALEEA